MPLRIKPIPYPVGAAFRNTDRALGPLPYLKSQPRLQLMNQAPPPGWMQQGDALTRTIQRTDFIEAVALVLEIAPLAEAANHHPDIDLRYGTVHLSLSTHSAGHKVTAKDFALAGQINEIAEGDIAACAAELRSRLKP